MFEKIITNVNRVQEMPRLLIIEYKIKLFGMTILKMQKVFDRE